VDTSLSSVHYLTARKLIIEKFFCIIVMMRWHTILLKVTHFLQKQNFLWMAQCCPAALISGQHLCHVHHSKMIVLAFQKTENTTLILVDYYSVFCYMQIFYDPLHTLVLIGSTINFKRFYRTKQYKEEKIFFICTVQKLVLGTPVSKELCLIDFLID